MRVPPLLALVSLLAIAAGSVAPDRVVVFRANDPAYAALSAPKLGRSAPEADEHLVVFHGGEPILDVGLKSEHKTLSSPEPDAPFVDEEEITDVAQVSPDGRSALILSSRVRRRVPLARDAGPKAEAAPVGTATLYWIDASRPESRVTLPIDDGRFVAEAIPLSGGAGFVLCTTSGPGEPADLRVHGAGGGESFRLPADGGAVRRLVATNNGAYLGADLAYPARPDGPDRGVLVLDILHGSHWTYTWSYGGEGEPLGWDLDENGILAVKIPGADLLFEPNGRPIGKRAAKAARREASSP